MTQELIFDSFDRTDPRPKCARESLFQFYNRSSWPSMARLRQFFTCAVQQYPAAERKEMIARLKKDAHIRSAEFELLLFQLLTRSGFEVEVHPELNNGSTRRPDFLVRTPDGESMLLEAITIEPTDDSGLDEHAIQVLTEGLRDARNEHYRVTVTVSGSTRKTPPARSFVAQVQQWLAELGAHTQTPWATRDWVFEGLTLTIEAHAISPGEAGPDDPLLAAYHRGAIMADGMSHLRDKLQTKAGAYGVTGLPLVVAINCQNAFHRDIDSIDALFGRGNPSQDLPRGRPNEGLWSGGRYSRMSAAWIFSNFSTIAFLRSPHTLYLNPGSTHCVPPALRRFTHAQILSTGRWEAVAGAVPMTELFGLDADWPGAPGPG